MLSVKNCIQLRMIRKQGIARYTRRNSLIARKIIGYPQSRDCDNSAEKYNFDCGGAFHNDQPFIPRSPLFPFTSKYTDPSLEPASTGRHGAKTMAEVVEVLVPGGKATAGPPLGPSLGPLGINVKAVVDEINKKTASFNGMQVPVKIVVDAKKNFTVTVGIPPTTALIKKEANIEKGSAEPNVKVVGNLPFEAAVRIANMKLEGMLAYELKTAVKEVVGTCVSMGVNVDGKRPKEVLAAIAEGKYDSVLVK